MWQNVACPAANKEEYQSEATDIEFVERLQISNGFVGLVDVFQWKIRSSRLFSRDAKGRGW